MLPFISTWGPPPRVVPHITVHRGSQCYRLAFWRCPTSRVARRPSVTCARCERCALPAFVAFDSWPWLQALRFSLGGRTVPCGRTVLWVTYGLLHDPITTPRLAFHVHMHMAAMRTRPGECPAQDGLAQPTQRLVLLSHSNGHPRCKPITCSTRDSWESTIAWSSMMVRGLRKHWKYVDIRVDTISQNIPRRREEHRRQAGRRASIPTSSLRRCRESVAVLTVAWTHLDLWTSGARPLRV